MDKDLARLIEVMKARQRFVVTSHHNIDGDGIGTLLSFYFLLTSLGKEAVMMNDGNIPYFYQFLPEVEKIISYQNFLALYPDYHTTFDALVVVDCSNLARLGKAEEIAQGFSLVINVDHHPDNSRFGTINWIASEASSTLLVYTLFKELKIPLNQKVATTIMNGLISDTGGFTFVALDRRMLLIVEDLIRAGARTSEIMHHNFRCRRIEALKLLGKALERLTYDSELGVSFTYITQEDFQAYDAREEDTEGIVDYGLYIPGAEIAVLFKEIGREEFKVSLRAQREREVISIAHHFGGGGHFKAAGFKIRGDLQAVIQKVMQYIQYASQQKIVAH